ncbi:MAG: hypothetical protein JWM40_2687 [Frankiales bacterium]|nr:hypothetical protein [Frankiales bacterium]
MAFGRRKKDDEDFVDDLDAEDRATEDAELLAEMDQEEAAPVRADLTGPWDLAAAPALDPPRLDLGSLHVPVMPDTDVRLEVSAEGEVVAATLVHRESALQLNAFAAPRSEGIWEEVRAEILQAVGEGGGQGSESDGAYGTELRAMVPTEVPGQGVVLAPARFVGVDGPRWFLRGLLTGPAATEDAAAHPLLQAMREVAVNRGTDPMAVRDPLPLVLPSEAMQAASEAVGEDSVPNLNLPERGPEITETR